MNDRISSFSIDRIGFVGYSIYFVHRLIIGNVVCSLRRYLSSITTTEQQDENEEDEEGKCYENIS